MDEEKDLSEKEFEYFRSTVEGEFEVSLQPCPCQNNNQEEEQS